MFGLFDDVGYIPSYYLAEITAVNVEDHTCTIQLLRGVETYDNVKIMTDIGNFSLPKVGDICITFWDNRNIPIVIGFYPVYHQIKLDENKYYNVLEGERMWQSEYGQKLIFNKRGEMYLTNWSGQGLEVYQNEGLAIIRSNSTKLDTAGVDKRLGYTQRYSPLARKDAIINTTTGLEASTIGTTPLVEDTTIITNSIGLSVYEHKIGNPIIAEDPAIPVDETKTVETHPTTLAPLRAKTTYYNSDGSAGVTIYIDIEGNLRIDMSAQATNDGVVLNGNGNNLTVDGFNTIKINGTSIELNGNSDNITLAAKLINELLPTLTTGILPAHTHTYTDDGNSMVTGTATFTNLITAANISSSTVKAS